MTIETVTIGAATLYLGDALEVLQSLSMGIAQAVITDPPYSSGGQFRGDRAVDTRTKYLSTGSSNQEKTHNFGGDTRGG
jgi:site-specific DNA-methyltransferase (adenine-specific)